MKERLREFMDQNGLSAKDFAERINVQASSISHILSGRNKPSLEFLEKLLSAFPNIDIKYLISGLKENTSHSEEKVIPSESISKDNQNRIIVLNSDGTYDEYAKQ